MIIGHYGYLNNIILQVGNRFTQLIIVRITHRIKFDQMGIRIRRIGLGVQHIEIGFQHIVGYDFIM